MIEYAAHTARLGDERGILVLPPPDECLAGPLPSGEVLPGVEGLALPSLSLLEADWDLAVRDLFERGFAPVEAGVGEPDALGALLVGVLPDGREVIALERV